MSYKLRAFLAALFLFPTIFNLPRAAAALPQSGSKPRNQVNSREKLSKEIHQELLLLPSHSVFDYLAFALEGDEVTLSGQVLRSTLKAAAESAVKNIEGVGSVVNKIQVLPASPVDDQLRQTLFRNIYGGPGLQRYATLAVPPIHIIVNNGSVTLEGVVDSDSDRNLAGLRATETPSVYSVQNNLAVAGQPK